VRGGLLTALDRAGRVIVNPDLSVSGAPDGYGRLGHRNFRNHSSIPKPLAVAGFCSHATWASTSGCLSVPFSMTTY